MIWAKVALAVLTILEWLVRTGQENKWIAEGEDRAIAAGLANVLRVTNYGKKALDEAHQLSDADLDELLRSFEKPDADNSKR